RERRGKLQIMRRKRKRKKRWLSRLIGWRVMKMMIWRRWLGNVLMTVLRAGAAREGELWRMKMKMMSRRLDIKAARQVGHYRALQWSDVVERVVVIYLFFCFLSLVFFFNLWHRSLFLSFLFFMLF